MNSEFKSRRLNQLLKQQLHHQQQPQQLQQQQQLRNMKINTNSMRAFNFHLQNAAVVDYKPHDCKLTKTLSNAAQQPHNRGTTMNAKVTVPTSCQMCHQQQRTLQQHKQLQSNLISLQQQCKDMKLKKPHYCMRHEVHRNRPRAGNKFIMQRLLSMFEVMPATTTTTAATQTRAVLQPVQTIRQGQKPRMTARLTGGGLEAAAAAAATATAVAAASVNKTKADLHHNLTYMQFTRHPAVTKSTKKYKPSDRDVIFGNARLLVPKACGWECSRIDWLLELERRHEEARRCGCKRTVADKPNDCIEIGYGFEFAEHEDEHMVHICCFPFTKDLLKWGGI